MSWNKYWQIKSVDPVMIYILHLFYLSKQIELTGYIYVIYCHCTKYSLFWYPFHMLPDEHWQPNCKSSSLPLDRKYQKGRLKTKMKARFIEPFPSVVPDRHKLYILRHCINIVFILQKNHINPLTFIFIKNNLFTIF
jgi:hypothetical protein